MLLDRMRQENMRLERRQRMVEASPAEIYRIFTGLGGKRGWFYMNWAWQIRGFMDRLVGGVGLRRDRRDPDDLVVGDVLDFWRVEALESDRRLRLHAEMKMPGEGWLEFEVTPCADNRTLLLQTAFYVPRGLMGQLYWYVLYPFHYFIFDGLIDQIARRAVASKTSAQSHRDSPS